MLLARRYVSLARSWSVSSVTRNRASTSSAFSPLAEPRQRMCTGELCLGPGACASPPPPADPPGQDPPARSRPGPPSGAGQRRARGRSRGSTPRGEPRPVCRRGCRPRPVRWRRVRATAAAGWAPRISCAPHRRADAPPDFDADVGVLETDQSPGVGLLDGVRIGDPPQRRQLDGLADGERVDDGADAPGRAPMRDSTNSTSPCGMIGSPIHRQLPCCLVEAAVGDFLLDDVAQIQDVAAGQLPQPPAASGSSDPPRVADNSVAVSSGDSGCRSSLSNWPAFQSSCIPAGIASPSRTVSTTLAARRCTI